MFELLHHYINHGYDTISLIIIRYAPPSDSNSTYSYILFVSDYCKIDSYATIEITNSSVLVDMVMAISLLENGVKADKSLVMTGFQSSSLNSCSNF
jgi:hypothetical protein